MDHNKHRQAEPPAKPETAAQGKRPTASAGATVRREMTAGKAGAFKDAKVAKGRVAPESPEISEDPEDYADPICVCEPEPYWQEVAERLERDSRAPK